MNNNFTVFYNPSYKEVVEELRMVLESNKVFVSQTIVVGERHNLGQIDRNIYETLSLEDARTIVKWTQKKSEAEVILGYLEEEAVTRVEEIVCILFQPDLDFIVDLINSDEYSSKIKFKVFSCDKDVGDFFYPKEEESKVQKTPTNLEEMVQDGYFQDTNVKGLYIYECVLVNGFVVQGRYQSLIDDCEKCEEMAKLNCYNKVLEHLDFFNKHIEYLNNSKLTHP